MSPGVDRDGRTDPSPGRQAVAGSWDRRRAGRGEAAMVPEASFDSYYGRPVLNRPIWKADIPAYLFLGGLAGGSSLLGAGAQLRGLDVLARRAKVAAAAAVGLSLGALVHDLGRPSRFLYMLRTFKPTSPMSVGSWLLAGYAPAAMAAAGGAVTGLAPRIGAAATAGGAALAPVVASYTAVLLSDTAVPSWHEAYRELPFAFVGSAAIAAGGTALAVTPVDQHGPARRMALLGVAGEMAVLQRMERRVTGTIGRAHRRGRPGRLLRAGQVLSVAGAALSLGGRSRRPVAALGGVALVAASACTRFGLFEAGVASADDPQATVEPQRRRVEQRRDAAGGG